MEEEQVFDIENRRSKRIPVGMHLEVSSVFKQNNVYVSNINAPIEVVDISKYGIGFVSASVLPIGFYFDSRLKFEDVYKKRHLQLVEMTLTCKVLTICV